MSLNDPGNILLPGEEAWHHRAVDALSGYKTVAGFVTGALGVFLSHCGWSATGAALTWLGSALLGAGTMHKYLKRRIGI